MLSNFLAYFLNFQLQKSMLNLQCQKNIKMRLLKMNFSEKLDNLDFENMSIAEIIAIINKINQ
jgi:hypothetical protein